MAVLAVAAVSARMLAEAATRDGYGVVALDLYGDADTRRAARCWRPIGGPGHAGQIDAPRLLDALRELTGHVGEPAIGWIPGSGFDGRPELLEVGARLLPLLGTPADAVRRVRDPAAFFGALSAHGIAFPEVRFDAPDDPRGWLRKDAAGSGGWQVRRAAEVREADAAVPPSVYFQRERDGVPMSATFLAGAAGARIAGFNELLTEPFGKRPHVYAGCIGPVELPGTLAQRLVGIVQTLAGAFALRGWCSLDFMRAGDAVEVLEVNPRAPASLALYAQRGAIEAHVAACRDAAWELPPPDASRAGGHRVAGQRIVYAARAAILDEQTAQRLASRDDVHDLPVAGARFGPGDPVCSVSAVADDAAQVRAMLDARRDDVMLMLESLS